MSTLDNKYFSVGGLQRAAWYCTFQPLDVDNEIEKMVLWLDANPKRRKRNYDRFIVNWLNKAHAQLFRNSLEQKKLTSVGTTIRPAVDYSSETADILARHPDLAK